MDERAGAYDRGWGFFVREVELRGEEGTRVMKDCDQLFDAEIC